MGASKSKVRKLNPKTVKQLQKNINVDFSKEEIEQWFREYQSSLRKGMNKLTMSDFRDIYNSVFEGDATEFVQHLFRSFDADNDGYVDFKEFIVGLCVSGSDKVETKLKWAFRMYDIDGNGSITRDEMKGMLKAIYNMISIDHRTSRASERKMIEDLITAFFESADKDHDNSISQTEFVAGVQEMPVILHLLQCDPEPEKLDPEMVSKFDNLDTTEQPRKSSRSKTTSDRASANLDTTEQPRKSSRSTTTSNRSSAYRTS